MFCNNCGKVIPDNSSFCAHCGNKIEEVINSDKIRAAENNINELSSKRENVSADETKSKIRVREIIISFIVLGIVVVIGDEIVMPMLKEKFSSGNTTISGNFESSSGSNEHYVQVDKYELYTTMIGGVLNNVNNFDETYTFDWDLSSDDTLKKSIGYMEGDIDYLEVCTSTNDLNRGKYKAELHIPVHDIEGWYHIISAKGYFDANLKLVYFECW